jgi:hypothetical protein
MAIGAFFSSKDPLFKLKKRVHFSCKISNAILTYLDSQGEDLSLLYDQLPWTVELLHDPSHWLSAPDMETFLETVLRLPLTKTSENAILAAGHSGPTNRAWGVLDSVLKMMPRPQDVFQQPQRFLSYFISPEPPVENVVRSDHKISFDLPLPAEQYPLVTSYLKAAFESLPLYVGQEKAVCEWNHITLTLSWSSRQSSMFAMDPGHQISPELLQNVIDDLQKHQLALEEKNRDLQRKNEELEQTRGQNNSPFSRRYGVHRGPELIPQDVTLTHLTFNEADPGYVIAQNLARLHDYMVRAQQLVTVLASQGKVTPAVKEIMRRVDWDFVKNQYPRTISESVEHLRKLQGQLTQKSNRESEKESEKEVENHV